MEIGRGLRIPLQSVSELTWNTRRSPEPVTIGIPLPAGVVSDAASLQLQGADGTELPLQVEILDRWRDQSARWALLDFQIRTPESTLFVGVRESAAVPADRAVRIRTTNRESLAIDTGAAVFTFAAGAPFPLGGVKLNGVDQLQPLRSGVFIETGGATRRLVIDHAAVEVDGPLRSVVQVRGRFESGDGPGRLQVSGRVELFAGLSTARIHVTIANTAAAQHAGGQWPLGDPASVLLKSAVSRFAFSPAFSAVSCSVEFGQASESFAVPFEIYQESSGGPAWNGPVHKNRDGVVSQKLKGYRARGGAHDRSGLRASPIVSAHGAGVKFALAVPQFWENCPRGILVSDSAFEFAFLPGAYPDLHELQGGERKTHTFVVDFGTDAATDSLAWCHDPTIFCPAPGWSVSTGAVPFLTAATEDDPRLAGLIGLAFDAQSGFAAKREQFDEYGWRHFGDLPADHESAFLTDGTFFVSHYNNQYDAIAAFGMQFLRSGDARWWRLMRDLARHVRDVDIYHTDHDKAAYCHGLFWHTAHYTDAATSTHRAYPRGGPGGGGPSAEHNYNAGLMLHYFLTGEPDSRHAALELADWVLAMDDGRRTVFRFLAGGSTGLASSTASTDYHGPGRGAGNSILACMTAHRLTGDARYLDKAWELVKRCAGPHDDFEAMNLRHIESRWSYTVFLQILGLFLHDRLQSGARSADESYVRDTLLHYARWMAANERPYLDQPDQLEFKTETWPAQDLRKADVFAWAARFGNEAERPLFLRKAAEFFEYAVTTLETRPTRTFTRPIVLVLANTTRQHLVQFSTVFNTERISWSHVSERPVISATAFQAAGFIPQKTRALRRAKLLGASVGAAGFALAFWVLLS